MTALADLLRALARRLRRFWRRWVPPLRMRKRPGGGPRLSRGERLAAPWPRN